MSDCHVRYRDSEIVGAWLWAAFMAFFFASSTYRFIDEPVLLWRGVYVVLSAFFLAVDIRKLVTVRKRLAHACPCKAKD